MKFLTLPDSNPLERFARALVRDHGIQVRYEGVSCSIRRSGDSWIVTLPTAAADPDATPGLLRMVRYWIDHELGHIVMDTDPWAFRALGPPRNPIRVAANALDDVRVEVGMAEKWVGCGANLSNGLKELYKKVSDCAFQNPNTIVNATITYGCYFGAHMGKRVLDTLRRLGGDPRILDVIEENFKEIRAVRTAESTEEVIELAKRLFEPLFKEEPPKPDPDDEQGDEKVPESDDQSEGVLDVDLDDDEVDEGEGEATEGSEGEGEGPASDSEPDSQPTSDSEPDSQEDSAGDGGPGDGEESTGTDSGTDSAPGSDQGGSGADSFAGGIEREIADAISDMSSRGRDGINHVRSEGESDVVEFDIHELLPEEAFADRKGGVDPVWFHKQVLSAGAVMRQRLASALQSESKVWWRSGQKRGRPDARRLAAMATGLSNRTMRRRFEAEAPDTAVYILVDASGSMSLAMDKQRAGESEECRMSRCRAAMLAAASCAHAIESSGHKVKIAQFSGAYAISPDTYYAAASRHGSALAQAVGRGDMDEAMKVAADINTSYWRSYNKNVAERPKHINPFEWKDGYKHLHEKAGREGREALMRFIKENLGEYDNAVIGPEYLPLMSPIGYVTLATCKDWVSSRVLTLSKVLSIAGQTGYHGGTPSGKAMEGALGDILSRPEKRKIIVLITDGHPDHWDDLQRAVRKCEAYGVEHVQIGIGAGAAKSIRRAGFECASVDGGEGMTAVLADQIRNVILNSKKRVRRI